MTDVAIVGAGVIGLSTALRLSAEGHAVTLIDPEPPGSGASHGNAGQVADYAVVPVGTPGLLRNLPALLMDRDSPFALRYGALPSLAPWLARFAWHCLPRQAEANARALADLLHDAGPLWLETAREAGFPELLRRDGVLYLYETAAAFEKARDDRAFRGKLGVKIDALGAAEVAQMEPALPPLTGGAHFFPDAIHLSDPSAVMARLTEAVLAAGVTLLPEKVLRLERQQGQVTLTTAQGKHHAETVVIAAGAHSRYLAAQAGDRVPLDTERGYHIEYDMPEPVFRRPVASGTRSFYAIQMTGRLRITGIVEMADLHRPPDPRLWDLLERNAASFLDGLGEPSRKWMGLRPSVPSSVPVIRASKAGGNVILAFGHGHLGVTLAPRTARMVADMVARRG